MFLGESDVLSLSQANVSPSPTSLPMFNATGSYNQAQQALFPYFPPVFLPFNPYAPYSTHLNVPISLVKGTLLVTAAPPVIPGVSHKGERYRERCRAIQYCSLRLYALLIPFE